MARDENPSSRDLSSRVESLQEQLIDVTRRMSEELTTVQKSVQELRSELDRVKLGLANVDKASKSADANISKM